MSVPHIGLCIFSFIIGLYWMAYHRRIRIISPCEHGEGDAYLQGKRV